MKTFVYATALCLASLAASGDYSDYTDGCPFLVAENKTGFLTLVACSHDCNGKNETIENGTRCFDIGDDVLRRMVPHLPYTCPLGECRNGDCIKNGKNETCYRRNEQLGETKQQ
ncbi:evasin-1-like isoform X1 [Rhipicephalus microplus]|uniref:evasin-1-like isoform X1 n=1 Tax=Rhipicephalus microplus TaxID=6941 RepID=UPI003F6CF102